MTLVLLGRKICTVSFAVALSCAALGCDDQQAATPAAPAPAAKPAPATQPLVKVPQMIDWCGEHAMPESICVQCNPSLAAAYKEKGDWDEAHGLPKSQCFKCDPSLKEKFAVAFKEKHGKDAPTSGHDGHAH